MYHFFPSLICIHYVLGFISPLNIGVLSKTGGEYQDGGMAYKVETLDKQRIIINEKGDREKVPVELIKIKSEGQEIIVNRDFWNNHSPSFNSQFGGLYDRKKRAKLEGPKDENDNTRVQTLNDFVELGNKANSIQVTTKTAPKDGRYGADMIKNIDKNKILTGKTTDGVDYIFHVTW